MQVGQLPFVSQNAMNLINSQPLADSTEVYCITTPCELEKKAVLTLQQYSDIEEASCRYPPLPIKRRPKNKPNLTLHSDETKYPYIQPLNWKEGGVSQQTTICAWADQSHSEVLSRFAGKPQSKFATVVPTQRDTYRIKIPQKCSKQSFCQQRTRFESEPVQVFRRKTKSYRRSILEQQKATYFEPFLSTKPQHSSVQKQSKTSDLHVNSATANQPNRQKLIKIINWHKLKGDNGFKSNNADIIKSKILQSLNQYSTGDSQFVQLIDLPRKGTTDKPTRSKSELRRKLMLMSGVPNNNQDKQNIVSHLLRPQPCRTIKLESEEDQAFNHEDIYCQRNKLVKQRVVVVPPTFKHRNKQEDFGWTSDSGSLSLKNKSKNSKGILRSRYDAVVLRKV